MAHESMIFGQNMVEKACEIEPLEILSLVQVSENKKEDQCRNQIDKSQEILKNLISKQPLSKAAKYCQMIRESEEFHEQSLLADVNQSDKNKLDYPNVDIFARNQGQYTNNRSTDPETQKQTQNLDKIKYKNQIKKCKKVAERVVKKSF